jgi:hypothetical protein
MQRTMKWLGHAMASLVAAIIATGVIYQLPPNYQPYAIAVLAVIGYLLGVKMPTPGYQHLPLNQSSPGVANNSSANNLLRGQF